MARGHAVRGTTRDPTNREAIEAVGAEAVIGDPDRVVTLAPAFDHVAVAYVLLGSARADGAHASARLSALHGPRLEMLLLRMLDTTVRGIVYEAWGSVERRVLEAGGERVRAFCEDSRIPYVLLKTDPCDVGSWLKSAASAAERVLVARQPG